MLPWSQVELFDWKPPPEGTLGFNVQNTLLGLSSVYVSVPPANVKSLLLDDWSVIVFPSCNMLKPFVPSVKLG